MAPTGGRRALVGHDFVDHTSELILRLRAPDMAGLIAEATRAFAELVPRSDRGSTPSRGGTDAAARDFRLTGPDSAAVLVEWLNELVYVAEAESWLATEVQEVRVETDGESALAVRVSGEVLYRPFVLVKAATLHEASVRSGAGGLEAEVTLDI